MSRINDILKINQDALEFINKWTPAANGIDFIDNAATVDELTEFECEELNELPNVSIITRHGFHTEYAVIRLKRNENNMVIAVLYGRGEDTGQIMEVFVDELNNTEICDVADMLEEKLIVDED